VKLLAVVISLPHYRTHAIVAVSSPIRPIVVDELRGLRKWRVSKEEETMTGCMRFLRLYICISALRCADTAHDTRGSSYLEERADNELLESPRSPRPATTTIKSRRANEETQLDST
jgi:hypothetical protein